MNPLQYWKEHKKACPELINLALKVLLVPASSVASERVGSDLKNFITDKKCRIGDDYLSQRLFMSSAPFDLVADCIQKGHISVPDNKRFSFDEKKKKTTPEE